jgi:hypothetical protein
MKYYEVRCNHNNTRVCLLKTGYQERPNGKIIYEGEFPLTKAFINMKDGFFKPKFEGYDDDGIIISKTKEKLEEMGFHQGHYNKELDWVVNDSDHRDDVRIIDENMYKKINNNQMDIIIVQSCDHLDSTYPESFSPIFILATKANHQLGDISRRNGDIAIVSQKDDQHYCGQWANGFGFFNVKFPIETSKVISKEEAEKFLNQ